MKSPRQFRRHTIVLLLAVAWTAFPLSGQNWALERLNESPRHHEWLKIKGRGRTVHAFVVYPEISEKATSVLVIHENRGLTDWVRGVADQLAEQGYIAIAPDLLSGMGPDGGKTSDFADRNAARDAIYKLEQDNVTADLQATADYVVALPAANGKLAVSGFCWGGRQSFVFSTNRKDLEAAFVFYGTPPADDEALGRITCPVYGFYGGSDARVNATIPDTETRMKSAGNKYEPVTYDGAGHGFMRSGEDPDASDENRAAREKGWKRWLSLLEEL